MANHSPDSKAINSDQVEGTGENVLAKHVAFFDRNHDGVVYPWETFQGFRAIGAGLLLSTAAGFVINMSLSHKTRPGKFPNLLFPIEIKNIAKAKHGSDSGVYDTQGRFVPSKFEAIFSKHAHSNSNALTREELGEMLKANRQPKDYFGQYGAHIEWKILFDLCKNKNGVLEKDTVRGVYDGSLFEKMEMETKASKKSKHG
ncbi:putative peroxygenase 4 [Silene latifolia]|uniref:putative peroxygenase 4 n=1 Tax=Silene latifolia TaxID=37657 RepID=UPI003D76FDC5